MFDRLDSFRDHLATLEREGIVELDWRGIWNAVIFQKMGLVCSHHCGDDVLEMPSLVLVDQVLNMFSFLYCMTNMTKNLKDPPFIDCRHTCR